MIEDHFVWAGRDEARASANYADDAVLEFPQGGERLRGRTNILAMRTAYPSELSFTIDRTIGRGDLWVNEFRISYDGGRPKHVIGVMEFAGGKVSRERLYVTDSWEPPAWRAEWVERMSTDSANA